MPVSKLPSVGDWYATPSGDTFEVVAYDPDEESVEIQYFDGAVEELDLETWLEINASAIEAPEDWSGALDLTREDGLLEDRATPFMPGNPLDDPKL